MSRRWTARKTTPLNEPAVDAAAFAPAFPLFRAGPEPAAAGKEALRFLTGFTLLGVPVHCGICWLAGHSLGLTAAAVLVTVAALLAVALARWLALEDLLQRLPLLLLLGLVGVGLVFVTSLPTKGWGGGGMELLGGVLILVTVVSILGSLYRPLSAAYQTVTLKIPFRDLCVAAAAMLVSLGLAALGQTLPRPALPILTCALGGTLAGLVVVEYAAWARANPGRSLERARAFDGPPAAVNPAPGAKRKPARQFNGRAAVVGAAVFGLSYGVFSSVVQYGIGPSSELRGLFPASPNDKPGTGSEFLAVIALYALVGMPFGWYRASSAVNGLRFPNPVLAVRLAWDAVAVFLTYPEPAHPLAHRLHTRWLRPQSVRLAGTCVVLLTAATGFVTNPDKPKPAGPESKSASVNPPAPQPPAAPRYVPQGDRDAARIEGRSLDGLDHTPFTPPPVLLPPPVPSQVPADAPESRPLEDGVTRFILAATATAVAGPLFLFFMVWLVGLSALPAYYGHFEQPETPAKPR
ncbi:MAG: hypothetical protein C0501_29775 [Isosphaera sp.]|nr:hypothetical protein [Isosphaera sp.]